MAGELRGRTAESAHALREVFRNPGLRRLELAWVGSVAGEWSFAVALAVYAYDSGGAAAVGLVGLIRFLPAAVAAPFAALLGDLLPRRRVMLLADLARAAAMAGAAAAAMVDAPAGTVYALAGLTSLVSTAFQPAQAALLPSLARTPQELTAANVASGTIESVGSFVGPALGGLLLVATGTSTVFAATAWTFLWSALLVSGIRAERDARPRGPGHALLEEVLAGFQAIASESRLRLLVGLYGAQTLVAGALNVLIVVCALELLDLGESGVGWLNSAVGAGGLFGAAAALALIGRRRLAADFRLGLVLWGAPIALIGLWPEPAAVLLFLGLVGVGNTIVDVAGVTLLQRTVADEVLARVFGVLEGLVVGTIGLGAVLAPLLVEGVGIRGALVATGALLPVLALLAWRSLTALDAAVAPPEEQLAVLRAVPLFAPLPPATLEHLAASLSPVHAAAGETIVRERERGDRFYILKEGRADVFTRGRRIATLEPGGYFGEIALLRSVPRTATVRAKTEAELYALEQDEFIAAVTGHPASADAADAVIGARLGGLRPGMASV
jgi:Cyclic nucleotide-binding domain/Major Facilitator Superfamily